MEKSNVIYSFAGTCRAMDEEADNFFKSMAYKEPYSVMINTNLERVLIISKEGVKDAFEVYDCEVIYVVNQLFGYHSGFGDYPKARVYGIRNNRYGKKIFLDRIVLLDGMYNLFKELSSSVDTYKILDEYLYHPHSSVDSNNNHSVTISVDSNDDRTVIININIKNNT